MKSEEEAMKYLESLIKENKLNLMMDPIEKVVVLRRRPEEEELVAYRRLAKKLVESVRERERQLINFDIVQGQRMSEYS